MFYLMANRHYSGYDRQEELATYPTREAAEMAAADLIAISYVHDEGEVSRPTYVIVGDWTGDQTDEPERTVETADGSGAAAKPARVKAGRNRSPK